MDYSRYYTFITCVMVALPYGWGVPRFVWVCVPVSVFVLWIARKLLLGFDQARREERSETMFWFAGAAALVFAHTGALLLLIPV